ncbi:MAG: biopolymer transporter ExbD [Caulobacter sp.]|nr:biopolymer transporter ExbD [Caulobacter sp.]
MGAKLAGAAGGRHSIPQNAEINVTPFVDVMLVLLIIFMVAAPMATVSIALDLPPAEADAPPPPNGPTYVSIQKSGALFIGEQATSLPSIGGDLARVMAAKGVVGDAHAERVYIRADAAIRYDQFMTVMNRLQDEGYYRVGLIGEEIE